MTGWERPLEEYLALLRTLAGAEAASLYAPGPESSPILIHDGEDGPVAALADEEAAAATYRARGAMPATRVHEIPADDPRCRILLVKANAPGANRGDPERRRRRSASGNPADRPPIAVAFRFAEAGAADPPGWDRLLRFAARLAGHSRRISSMLDDPTTGLPGRTALQSRLGHSLRLAAKHGEPFSLLLVNPDEFASVNDEFGSEAGDSVLREVASRLRSAHRRSDMVARFGGAMFGVVLDGTSPERASALAEQLLDHLTSRTYAEGGASPRFSIGVAGLESGEDPPDQPLDIVRRADQALRAAKRSASRVAVWRSELEDESAGFLDRLSGIFTGDLTRDYRNMMALWDTINLIAAHPDPRVLSAHLIETLRSTFGAVRVDLVAGLDGGSRSVLASSAAKEHRPEASPGHREALTGKCCHTGRIVVSSFEQKETGTMRCCVAVPMTAGDRNVGCLYLEGPEGGFLLDSADRVFLLALGAQIGLALERARWVEQERIRQEEESARLRADLDLLRDAVRDAKLEYRSPQMEAVLETARQVAPTEATVLITGESGTGKEVLARTVHRLSARSHRPLVVVDCGAITPTLIDSELFGHERGAYTGAQDRRTGRLAQADGATVLLDEIGELPLEVQSRLLRFVQDRQITPVGGSKPRTVDVRVIAATNRDLAKKVEEGTFRRDLYYRLNVVRLAIPPLRERPEDIVHLAEHYLGVYSAMYQKPVRRLGDRAKETLLRHDWPGNIRELQNRLMQAVILCGTESMAAEQLGLDAPGTRAPVAEVRVELPVRAESSAPTPVDGSIDELRRALARQIEHAVAGPSGIPLPVGKWLAEDLVLAADDATRGVARRGAATLGVPETTFRRRLGKARQQSQAGLAFRPEWWTELRETLERLVRSGETGGEDLIELLESTLLEQIMRIVPGDSKTGAALLGVTERTFVRRLPG